MCSMQNTLSLLHPPPHAIPLLQHWSFHGPQSFSKNLLQQTPLVSVPSGNIQLLQHGVLCELQCGHLLWKGVLHRRPWYLLQHHGASPPPPSLMLVFPLLFLTSIFFLSCLSGVFCLSLNIFSQHHTYVLQAQLWPAVSP